MRAGADPPWVSVTAGVEDPAGAPTREAGSGGGPGERVAFVFEGGGSYGAVQVGMLHALADAGIRPDLVVGTSVGAMNGAMVAAGPDLERAVGALERMWSEIRRRDVLPVRPVDAFRALAGRRAGLVPDEGLGRVIDRWLPVTDLEDLVIPFAAVATDIESGEPVLLRSGPARPALLASGAIPGVYAPVRLGGRTLVDGGVVANFPVEFAARLGATRIYALPTAVSAPSRLRGPLALVQRASDVLIARASRHAIEAAASAVVVHELPAPVTTRSMFDFRGSGELAEAGFRQTERWLAGLPAEPSGAASAASAAPVAPAASTVTSPRLALG